MSGAKNCPETPRQKMIGMMYLFLTAMLALNVSSEVLNGFVLVNNSMLQSITSSDARNANMYQRFKNLDADNPGKVGEWLNKALVVKQRSDEMFKYVENFKYQLVRLADGKEAKINEIKNLDNLDVAGQYALVQGHGKELKQKLSEYKEFLKGFVNGDPVKISMFDRNFATKGGKDGKNWQENIFEMMPVAAATTILTKYQTDIRAAEGEVVQYLMAQTDAGDFRVNKLQAYVIPVSTYVMQGDKYSAQIVLSAIDSTKIPQVMVNGRTLGRDGKLEMVCGQVGSYDYKGVIRLNSGGVNRDYPFAGAYTVGAKSATVTNTALNVVYAGIENELSASVPGVAASNIQLACAGGSVSRKPNGLWTCRTNVTSGKINFSVSAKLAGGNSFVPMGTVTFNVRQLPDPRPFLAYNAGGVEKSIIEGNITLSQLNGAVIKADYVNELISANFTVVSFTLEYPNGEVLESNGSTLSAQQKNRLAQERVGSRILVRGIKAVGPDRLVRSLPLLAVKLSGR
ncbi:MAG: gliding motility protein GldM [Bacteroidota bacterium]|nr:gliding motility protein GldM [Bacteroidota bacterium]